MSTTFILLTAAGAVLRALLSRVLLAKFGIALSVPSVITGGLIVLALLPSWLSTLAFPLPLGLTIGLLLPDILFRRIG